MLQYIKKQFIENPDKLKDFLEQFGYCNIKHYPTRVQFGRDDRSGRNAIYIYLTNNENLFATDKARNINVDIFSMVIEHRGVEFREVLSVAKSVLGIDNFYDIEFADKKVLFGGYFNKIKKRSKNQYKVYDESILDKYDNAGNIRFLRDNISLKTQKKFGIRYDILSQGIVIPIYNEFGELIGVKERKNCNADETDMKYFYDVPCSPSNTLYGYSQNYQWLVNADNILVYEAEKSTMQCDSYDIHNCVSLFCCSLTSAQAKLLVALHPKRITFMLDKGLDKQVLERNIEILRKYSKHFSIEIAYWDSELSNLADKSSPSDHGKSVLEYILNNETKVVNS